MLVYHALFESYLPQPGPPMQRLRRNQEVGSEGQCSVQTAVLGRCVGGCCVGGVGAAAVDHGRGAFRPSMWLAHMHAAMHSCPGSDADADAARPPAHLGHLPGHGTPTTRAGTDTLIGTMAI